MKSGGVQCGCSLRGAVQLIGIEIIKIHGNYERRENTTQQGRFQIKVPCNSKDPDRERSGSSHVSIKNEKEIKIRGLSVGHSSRSRSLRSG